MRTLQQVRRGAVWLWLTVNEGLKSSLLFRSGGPGGGRAAAHGPDRKRAAAQEGGAAPAAGDLHE